LALAGDAAGFTASRNADWTGLDWTGLDWTGLDWTGLDWTGLDWTGLDWTVIWIILINESLLM